MQADYERAVVEHTIDLLILDGALAGLVETILRPDHLWIENVAVSPDHQGKGFARRLLAHVERKAASSRRAECRLLINAAFEANIALYTRLGYVIDKREPFLDGVTVHMSKRLS